MQRRTFLTSLAAVLGLGAVARSLEPQHATEIGLQGIEGIEGSEGSDGAIFEDGDYGTNGPVGCDGVNLDDLQGITGTFGAADGFLITFANGKVIGIA